MIVRAISEDNARLDPRDRATIDSIGNHCQRHFPVQDVARATYRQILERRAQENRVDFVAGVATALTPLAFFDILMNKAFRSLVHDDAEVSVETGLRAAEKLQSVLDKRDQGDEIADMRRQVNMITAAVKSVVPKSVGARLSRGWTLSSIHRSSTLRPRLLTTTRTPTTRPGSPRRTTSLTFAAPVVTEGDGGAVGVDRAFRHANPR